MTSSGEVKGTCKLPAIFGLVSVTLCIIWLIWFMFLVVFSSHIALFLSCWYVKLRIVVCGRLDIGFTLTLNLIRERRSSAAFPSWFVITAYGESSWENSCPDLGAYMWIALASFWVVSSCSPGLPLVHQSEA